MLKKLDWFIIKSYLIPFIITFFIAEFVLVIQFLFVYLDDLVGKGVGFNVILELLFYAFSEVVPMALPLAVLLSSIMAMGNLGEKNELTAMKAAGVSLIRIMRPLIIVMMFIGGISFYFSNYIWGEAYLKKRILITDVTNKKLSLILKEGVFFTEIENYSIRANNIDKENNELNDVLIFEHSPSFKYRKIIRAEKGKMNKSNDGNSLILKLFNGEITEIINPSSNSYEENSILPHQQISFDETTQKIDISSLGLNRTSEEDYQNQPQTLPLSKLSYVIDSLSLDADTIKRTLLSYYKNSHLASRIEGKYDIDTIAKTTFNIDSLTLQEQKSVVSNAKNRVVNSISYLETRGDEFESKQKHLSRIEIEWHRKLTLSLACLILFFIGAPMGAIVKKGGFGVPIAIAIGMFLVYYIISITGERLASSLVLPPYIGMWLGSIVLFPLGVLLTYQAVTESKVMDFEAWGGFFRKVFSIKRKLDDRDMEVILFDNFFKRLKVLLSLDLSFFLFIIILNLFSLYELAILAWILWFIKLGLSIDAVIKYDNFYKCINQKRARLPIFLMYIVSSVIPYIILYPLAISFIKTDMKENMEIFRVNNLKNNHKKSSQSILGA